MSSSERLDMSPDDEAVRALDSLESGLRYFYQETGGLRYSSPWPQVEARIATVRERLRSLAPTVGHEPVGYARLARFRAGGAWQIEGTTLSQDGAHRWLELMTADARTDAYEYAVVRIPAPRVSPSPEPVKPWPTNPVVTCLRDAAKLYRHDAAGTDDARRFRILSELADKIERGEYTIDLMAALKSSLAPTVPAEPDMERTHPMPPGFDPVTRTYLSPEYELADRIVRETERMDDPREAIASILRSRTSSPEERRIEGWATELPGRAPSFFVAPGYDGDDRYPEIKRATLILHGTRTPDGEGK